MRMASATCAPILNTGLSDVIGSWKTMAMSLPRTWRMSRSEIPARSRPLKRTSPPVIFPGGATSRMMDMAVTLLPQPDSPTSATASPLRTLKETLSTACTAPNDVRRFRTSRMASRGSASRAAASAPRIPTGCCKTVTGAMVARRLPSHESRQRRPCLPDIPEHGHAEVDDAEYARHQRRLGDVMQRQGERQAVWQEDVEDPGGRARNPRPSPQHQPERPREP